MKADAGNVIDSIESLIFNSSYKVLSWSGAANNLELTQLFANDQILGKRICLKSIRIIPYASEDTDIFFNGTTVEHFIIPTGGRLINVIDLASAASRIIVSINGTSLPIFPSNNVTAYPLDLFVDNIYFIYKEKVSNITIQITGDVILDLDPGAGTTTTPNLKVLIECYTF